MTRISHKVALVELLKRDVQGNRQKYRDQKLTYLKRPFLHERQRKEGGRER